MKNSLQPRKTTKNDKNSPDFELSFPQVLLAAFDDRDDVKHGKLEQIYVKAQQSFSISSMLNDLKKSFKKASKINKTFKTKRIRSDDLASCHKWMIFDDDR